MNIFNRVIMVLSILSLFVLATIVLTIPQESLLAIKGLVDASLYTYSRIRPEFILPFRALLVLCALLLDLLLIGLLLLEVRRPARRTLHVAQVGGGSVSVTAESLTERIRYHVDQITGVIGVKVQAAPKGNGVDLDIYISTGADANVPQKAEEVLHTARQVVEDKMGLKLAGKPRVHVHAMPYPGVVARSAAATRALTSFAPTPPPQASLTQPPAAEGEKGPA